MIKIKICGLKTIDDVLAVNKYLPEYVGFVFANTKRFVTDEQALNMKKALDKNIKTVGVFVNEPVEHVIALCENKILDAVQLHGDEDENYIRTVKQKTGKTVIKALKVQRKEQVLQGVSKAADYMLYDTYKKGVLGGTGERFPLEILQECITTWQQDNMEIKPFFLAGGLDADNVSRILNSISCYCVDVSSGVETDGKKDETKIKEFIEQVRR